MLADRVGLSKTFEPLAIIKYYELRNDYVLLEKCRGISQGDP
jgi:hypothetical protein